MKIIECPRDAMQGVERFIPTADKAAYINQLLKVGFDTIDFGSFVSPKAIPQMKDTGEVLDLLSMENTRSKLLAIVANTRGAVQACDFEQITYLGFPMSISETFQLRNTNKSIAEALNTLNEIQEVCQKNSKTLVTYISMGFGNPYGDIYDEDIVAKFVDILTTMKVNIISLADTVGVSNPHQIQRLFGSLSQQYPDVELGAHLHSNPATAVEKIDAAYRAGCKRFDGAIKGWGGCPMAEDELVGNIATETIIAFLEEEGESLALDKKALASSIALSDRVFPN
ncbi:MAG: hydroxymethylglutaryl-CoA lyase [Cyclobacteriaceae bacterium]